MIGEAYVMVNICQHTFKQFLRLYIFVEVGIGMKMYNLKNCNPPSKQMLTATLEKFSSFFHFLLDF